MMPSDTVGPRSAAEYTPEMKARIDWAWAVLNAALGRNALLLFGGKAEFIRDMLLFEHACPMDWSRLQREREGYALSVIVAVRRAITPQGRVDLTRLVPGSLTYDAAIADVEAAAALKNVTAMKQGEQK
jgi:hypothetical protein